MQCRIENFYGLGERQVKYANPFEASHPEKYLLSNWRKHEPNLEEEKLKRLTI